MSEEVEEVLDVVQLSEEELQSYSLVLALGNVTLGDLVLLQGFSVEQAEEIISKLEERRMVVKLPGIVTRYQAVPPFEGLAEEIGTVVKKIDEVREQLRKSIETSARSVRDALLELAKGHHADLKQQGSALDAARSEATGAVSELADRAKKEYGDALMHEAAELETTLQKWSDEAGTLVETEIGQTQEAVSSTWSDIRARVEELRGSAKESAGRVREDLSSAVMRFRDGAAAGLKAQGDSAKEGIQREIDTLKAALEEQRAATDTTLQELGSNAENTGRQLAREATGAMDTALQDIEQAMSRLTTEVQEGLDSVAADIGTVMEEAGTRETQMLDEHRGAVKADVEAFVQRQSEAAESFKLTTGQALDHLVEVSNSSITSIREQLDSAAGHSEAALNSAMQSMKDNSVAAVQGMYDSTVEMTQLFSEETRGLLNTKKTELENTVHQIRDSFITLNDRMLESSRGLLDTTRTTVVEQMAAIVQQTRQEMEKLTRETQQQLARLADTLKQSIDTTVASTTQEIHAINTAVVAMLEQQHEALRNEFEEKVNDLSSKVQEGHDTLAGTIAEETDRQVTLHDEAIGSVLSKVDELKGHVDRKADSVRRETVGRVETVLSGTTADTIQTIKTMREETTEVVTSLATAIQDAVDNTRNKAAVVVEQFKRTAGEAGSTLQGRVDELVQTLTEKTKADRDRVQEDVNRVLHGASEHMGKAVPDVVARLRTEGSSVQERVGGALSGAGEQARMAIAGAAQGTAEAIDGAIQGLDETRGTISSNIATALEQVGSRLADHCDSMVKSIDSAVSVFQDKVEADTGQSTTQMEAAVKTATTRLEKVKTDLKGAVTTAGSECKEIVTRISTATSKKVLGALEKFANDARGRIGSTYDSIRQTLDSLTSSLEEHISDLEGTPMLGVTEETVKTALKETEVGELAGMDVATVLSKVWDRLAATDFPGAKHTWTVVTRKAVLSHIEDMVRRAKSKVTLIVPDPRDVPTQTLAELKSSIGVELVVTEGGNLETAVKPLVGRGNIRVRVRAEKDVYACVRDSEEVLLAPAATRDSDVIGMTSEYEGMVRFVMGIVGPIFQARTRMLRPGDI